jgi:hypothetical protein
VSRRIVSLWDWARSVYLYYAADPAPRSPLPSPIRPPLGDPPELLLPDLPANATYVGWGYEARGEIVVPNGAHHDP